jgi:VWFA-related protein
MGRLVASVLLGTSLVAARADGQQPSFRGTSDNVPVFVTVTGPSRQLVTDLPRSAFEVRDDGKPQPLTVFDNSPQPVRLIVLIDVSGSMGRNLPILRSACTALIRHLGVNDRARIGTFGTDITISPTFTRDEDALLDALPTTILDNALTPLWAAIDRAIGEFGDAEGRRVVLVLSDGKDSGPQRFTRHYLTLLDDEDRAQREDVMVYGIGLQSRPSLGAFGPTAGANLGAMMAASFPDPGLGTLALGTGGGYVEIRPRDDLSDTFGRVVDELHQQYLLGFTPRAHDGKAHKIEVRVSGKGMKARARKEYWAGNG